MLSRWTDFLITDGEKEWRNRDGEFESSIRTKEEMIANAIDGYLAGFARVSGKDAKRPAAKSNRLNAAAAR